MPHASGNCVQVHRVERDRQVGQVKVQPPGQDEEELIGVVVNMFGEVTGDVGDLDVVVVDFADDVRGLQQLDLVERLVHVSFGSHKPECCNNPS